MILHTLRRLIELPATLITRSVCTGLLALVLGYGLPVAHTPAQANNTLEYKVKAAFIYNFIAFTQWPEGIADHTINLCLYGEDYFGKEIDKLQEKSVGARSIKVLRVQDAGQLKQCQAVFFSRSAGDTLPAILSSLSASPVLTLADNPNAMTQGIAINMNLVNDKIVFEINLGIARKNGLDISSKLLQLATKVHQ
ncbi:MAG: YfiR family protein [Gammaproteobacteria bacterium]|nr:MAG: YfiR family protein [Gammaproteobacteria bacterium]